MFKGVLVGVGAVAVALTMAFSPSITAHASTAKPASTTLDYEPVFWGSNTTWKMCLDDTSNLTTTGNPLILVGSGNNDCGGRATDNYAPLTGALFAGVSLPDGDFALQLKTLNAQGQAMCVDDRGSYTNGTQYVIKPCNGGYAQDFQLCSDSSTGLTETAQFAVPPFGTPEDVMWLSGNNTANGTPVVVHSGPGVGRTEAYWDVASYPASQNFDPYGPC